MASYTIDPTRISLETFRKLTAAKKLLPGRVILGDAMEERFGILEKQGISNLGELLKALGNKKKVEAFARESKLPENYLIILKREAGSYLARPQALDIFPGIPFEYTEILKSKGISSTRDFFEQFGNKEAQDKLSKATGIPSRRLLEMHQLCDLVRVTGFGGTSARLVYEAGVHSIKDLKEAVLARLFREEDVQYCMAYIRIILELDEDH